MEPSNILFEKRGFGQTSRQDLWWVRPGLIFLALSSFIVYATWAAFQGEHYAYGAYLSPFYSPEIFGSSPHSWFGPKPGWWPLFLPFSPALLILWAPGGMRFTCYYYRGAYYKSFWADPPSCAVSEPRKKYWGENSFPLIMQNIHRYFLYLAILFVFILAYDAWKALWFIDPVSGNETFGLGVGSLVLATNAVLLGGYTFGCHSFRHLVGGFKNQLSKSPIKKTAYNCASCLNRRHMNWAWFSLFWVAFSDFYVRMCSMGIFMDWRIF
ncbi:hypothetical protein QQ008_14020 [Fulvivirgaceae bacterium BMA10]|uniref:Succinate dehydrogenase n=1 Tax=Splendidivirga corallicola TaxID=3051826 RepID=A0ABT8KQM1_9BACT|nr:hypothetical protein [Fulvivirgaceae bacterium BMA10]